MEVGFRDLRLSSKNFWRMTPRELVAALGGTRRSVRIDRGAFETLQRMFPDAEKGVSDGG